MERASSRQHSRRAVPRNEMSPGARHMLRAVRDHVNAEGIYQGTIDHAARLAGVNLAEARRSLRELTSRYGIRLAPGAGGGRGAGG